MNTDVKIAKQVLCDKLESQMKTAEAKLVTLQARAEAAKADLEIKAIAKLLPQKHAIEQKLQQLRTSAGDQWEKAKTDLQARIADFEKSLKQIESKAKAS